MCMSIIIEKAVGFVLIKQKITNTYKGFLNNVYLSKSLNLSLFQYFLSAILVFCHQRLNKNKFYVYAIWGRTYFFAVNPFRVFL